MEFHIKGTNDYKESEQCWDIFLDELYLGELVFPVSSAFGLTKFLWMCGMMLTWKGDILKFFEHTSNELEIYNAIIFAPPVIPISKLLYALLDEADMFCNEWRMLLRRTTKPFQTSMNHYLEISVEFYHDAWC